MHTTRQHGPESAGADPGPVRLDRRGRVDGRGEAGAVHAPPAQAGAEAAGARAAGRLHQGRQRPRPPRQAAHARPEAARRQRRGNSPSI